MDESYQNTKLAKNVILLIGDGMSIPTITASRIYKEQVVNGNFETPESGSLNFEKFPHMGLIKVCNCMHLFR